MWAASGELTKEWWCSEPWQQRGAVITPGSAGQGKAGVSSGSYGSRGSTRLWPSRKAAQEINSYTSLYCLPPIHLLLPFVQTQAATRGP